MEAVHRYFTSIRVHMLELVYSFLAVRHDEDARYLKPTFYYETTTYDTSSFDDHGRHTGVFSFFVFSPQ